MTPFLLGVIAFVMLITVGVGVISILLGVGTFSLVSSQQFFNSLAGQIVLYVLGGVFVGVGLYFAALFHRGRIQLARFAQEGELGKIELSPYALREFVSGIMKDEIGIDRFQVQLQHRSDGMSIRITTALSPEDQVAEIGKLIQETLSRRVFERTGIEVSQVSVLVNSIQAHEKETVIQEEDDERIDVS